MEKIIRVLTDLQLTEEEVLKAVRLDDDGDEESCERVLEMAKEACALARPKYLYGEAKVTERGEGFVRIGDVPVRSTLVAKNLVQVDTVHPYLTTCGTEVEQWSLEIEDIFEQYWADAIKLLILGRANAALEAEVRETVYGGKHMARMNPGSVPSWPLTGQRELFEIIGGVTESTGITLTESCLMLPSKSTSGMYFTSADQFVNCAYCSILSCPNRLAAYVGEF